jgi:hypothetical protein
MAARSKTDITALTNRVYDALLPIYKKKPDRIFDQDFLEKLDCVAEIKSIDSEAYGNVVNQLISLRIFKIVKYSDGNIGFKLRLKVDAEK